MGNDIPKLTATRINSNITHTFNCDIITIINKDHISLLKAPLLITTSKDLFSLIQA